MLGTGDPGVNQTDHVLGVLQKHNKYLEILGRASHYFPFHFGIGCLCSQIRLLAMFWTAEDISD